MATKAQVQQLQAQMRELAGAVDRLTNQLDVQATTTRQALDSANEKTRLVEEERSTMTDRLDLNFQELKKKLE